MVEHIDHHHQWPSMASSGARGDVVRDQGRVFVFVDR